MMAHSQPRVALIDPLAVIDGREVLFLRDNFGGEVPLSCAYPPLELAFTASLLRENGVEVDLIAANVLGLRHETVVERLVQWQPNVVLFPSAWGSLLDDFHFLRLLRAGLPKATLMICGPNVTAEPARVFTDSPVDVVVLGEPEEAALLIAQGTNLADVPNIAYREGEGFSTTKRRPPPQWESYPLPARDLLDLSLYTVPFSRRLPATTIATTRGCVHRCTFCPTQIWNGGRVRARPVALVLEEIDELVQRFGIRELAFRDDTFTGERQRVVDICEGLLARGHDLTWRCFATVSTVDPELLHLMAAAGCTQLCFGFESGDDGVLKKTGKGTTVAQGRQAVAWARDAGLEISGTFMVGLEGATADSVERSITFAIDNDLDYVQVNVAVAMPGTGFGKRKKKKGLESRPELFRWEGRATGGNEAVDAEDMPRLARRFYRKFYLRPRYVAGRLRSRRSISSLASHAHLGMRMARYVAAGLINR
ncbi:MAG: anaerobic magnesium-protoporphyrin IX monomethyl ester cyclase [Myxococcota bacterium]|jgi:anaerobic magnesium-protoporphyrin IX monomethyl ester cyclase